MEDNSRQAVAARNVEAILDAAEARLVAGAPLNFSALATDAGVSRPTVYSHFPERSDLITAVVQRSVRQAVAAIESADPDSGKPVEALERVIRSAWDLLVRHHELANAVGHEVPHGSMHSAHIDAMALLERLVTRGRQDGSFRQDLPVVWLVNAGLGLMHGAAATMHQGHLEADEVCDALVTSVVELFVGPPARRRKA